MSEQYKSAFFIIPSHIAELPGVTLSFIKVYETIFQFWNHKKSCYLSNEAIMQRTGISSEATIRKALMFFEKHEKIKRLQVGMQRFLVSPGSPRIEVDNHPKQGVPESTGGSSWRNGGGVPSGTHNKKNINIKNNNKSYCSSGDERLKNGQSLFNSFWNVCPRKIGRAKAQRIWEKNHYDDIASDIVEDVKNRMINDEQWQNERFIPYPATYLQDKRWEDEIKIRKIPSPARELRQTAKFWGPGHDSYDTLRCTA